MSITCPSCTYENNLTEGCNCKICNESLVSFDFSKLIQIPKISSKIQQNYDEAYNTIPESFFRTPMIYLPMSINDQYTEALIDTGAQISIISKQFAEKCGLTDLIDKSCPTPVSGVGSQTSYGKIWLTNILVDKYLIPCTFEVLDTFDIDVLFGLDLMTTHKCIIDIYNNKIKISGFEINLKKK